jgi:hypothetical protein
VKRKPNLYLSPSQDGDAVQLVLREGGTDIKPGLALIGEIVQMTSHRWEYRSVIRKLTGGPYEPFTMLFTGWKVGGKTRRKCISNLEHEYDDVLKGQNRANSDNSES